MKKRIATLIGTAFLCLFSPIICPQSAYAAQADVESDSQSQTSAVFVLQADEEKIEICLPDFPADAVLSVEHLSVTGQYEDAYGNYTHEWEIKKVQPLGENRFLITGADKLIRIFSYNLSACYPKDNTDASGPMLNAEISFRLSEASEKNTVLKKASLVLKNQEAIRITDTATMPNGTKPQNMRDVAAIAFSFMTLDKTPVAPTWEANATGITEIVSVKFRAIRSAKTVIVDSVVFKVFLDTDGDGIVTTEEKTTKALGYYYICADVDKTLTVEDWDIVMP